MPNNEQRNNTRSSVNAYRPPSGSVGSTAGSTKSRKNLAEARARARERAAMARKAVVPPPLPGSATKAPSKYRSPPLATNPSIRRQQQLEAARRALDTLRNIAGAG